MIVWVKIIAILSGVECLIRMHRATGGIDTNRLHTTQRPPFSRDATLRPRHASTRPRTRDVSMCNDVHLALLIKLNKK